MVDTYAEIIRKFKDREIKAKEIFDIREIQKKEAYDFVRAHHLNQVKGIVRYKLN